MKNLIKIIRQINLNNKQLIYLYSGFYDNHSLLDFIPDSNFIWLTNNDFPNLSIIVTNNQMFYYYDYSDNWIDHKNIELFNSTHDIEYIEYSKLIELINTYNQVFSLPKIDKRINLNNFNKLDLTYIISYCHEKRCVKSTQEITYIYQACKYTGDAILYALKLFKDNNYQYCHLLINDYIHYLNKMNIDYLAFHPICTTGKDNNIIHSNNYNVKIKKDDLLLLDIGCKYKFYCSDITRTFPISGKFTKKQLAIYNVVLKMNKLGIILSNDNISISYIENKCREQLYESLLKLNLIFPTDNDSIKRYITKLFMPHSISHSIGIDVHDTINTDILRNNMVITIEPGLYFYDYQIDHPNINNKTWNKYKQVGGIRIEDVVLINNDTPRVLSNFQKESNEIENLINLI